MTTLHPLTTPAGVAQRRRRGLDAGLLTDAALMALARPLRRRYLLTLDARQLEQQASIGAHWRRVSPLAVMVQWEWERVVSQARIAPWFAA